MKPSLFVVTQRGALAPASNKTRQELADLKLGPGDLVSVQVIRSRNARLCSLAHSVIAKLAEGLGVPAETVKTRLKQLLGYVDRVQMADGTVLEQPRSFAFDDLYDEDEFVDFWRAAEELICCNLLQELEPDEQAEVLAVMDGRR